MVHTRQHIEQRPIRWLGEPDAIGGHDSDVEGMRQLGQRYIVGFLISKEMPLQLDEDLIAAEQAHEAIEQAAHPVAARVEQRTPGQRHQPGRESFELLERESTLPLWRPHLHAGDEAAQVAIALGRGDQHRQSPCRTMLRGAQCAVRSAVGRGFSPGVKVRGCEVRRRWVDRQLRADKRPQPGALRRLVKSWRAVHTISIEQRQRRISKRSRTLDERFRQRGTLQKTERRRRVKLDVHRNRRQACEAG